MTKKAGNPTAGMLVIGDEILSGRTRDINLHVLAGALTSCGITLAEARFVADDHDAIVSAVQALAEAHTYVFTSGGIGPTHDDVTADSIAAAFEAEIDVREDARAILASHYARAGIEMNAARLRMARIPTGATLIDNPISAAPGFVIENVHVMAGVPSIFKAMLENVLPGLARGVPVLSRSLTVPKPEGEIAGTLGALAAEFGDLSFGSYPMHDQNGYRVNVVVRGTDPAMLDSAMDRLSAHLAVSQA